ncbi:glycosyltransferase [Bacteroides fluxus]|uniref:glycosyltransferase n=1 Tax=Bacteroides fluxus TaxID=626930 RepID=UPI002A7EF251|nr:glycosyltransferase [Bacteroides fluxus]MDY3789814.1 glycosyltransferase [Bacteroides fluxus]
MHMPPPVHGAAMMGKYIHDSKLINSTFDCHYINLTIAKSLQDIGKGGMGKLWKSICLLAKVIKTVNKLKPQLVYVTPNACGGAFYKEFAVIQLLKLLGQKVVIHYHNKGVAAHQDKRLNNFLYRRFFKRIKVILLAESLYQDIKKYVNKKDVYICPNGIPETLHTESVIKKNNSIPHLLFLSNLLISKGVFVLLDACKILKEKGRSFACEFVGGETTEIDATCFKEEVEKRDLNSVVTYEGRKYGEEKLKYLENTDLFVFPTYYNNECFPLVLLEAMEQGIVCISTNEGGIPAIIENGKTGYIVQKHSPEEIAEKIEYLIDHPEKRIAMGKAGKEKFLKEFTLDKFENRMKDILEDCISSR